jgi:flagellin-like hook-associated protein FlgL
MSNSKSAIKEIKNLMVQFGFLKSDEVELQSFKLEDDTILNTEKLEKGAKIYKIDEAFNQVSLEDGSYKLKENFEIEVSNGEIVTVKEIFVDAKLKDGTAIKVEGDTLDKGAKVVVVTPDAEIPAPDGTHELEDGTKVQTKDGVIVDVIDVANETPADEANEVPEGKDVEAPMGMSKEMMDMLKEFVSKMGEKMSQMEQSYSKLENEFKAFKKEPAAKKIADGKTDSFSKVNNEDHLDARVRALASLRNK